MLIGVTPGTYRTRDLYPRYQAWAERLGKPVASAKSLGEAIGRMGVERHSSSHGHVTVWNIAKSWTE